MSLLEVVGKECIKVYGSDADGDKVIAKMDFWEMAINEKGGLFSMVVYTTGSMCNRV